MATLSAAKPRVYETGHGEFRNELPVIASDIIYDGAAVGELNDTGTYQPLGTGSTVDKFAGFAIETVDNASGSAGAKKVKVAQQGRIILDVTGVTAITDVGKDVWATDDDAFTLTYAAGAIWIGRIARWITGTRCVVNFQAFEFRESFPVVHNSQTGDAATNRVMFLAPFPCYIRTLSEIHSVAAGGTSTLDVTKEVTTGAPGTGTALTTAAFDLNATANTLQTGALATTAGLRKLNTGDRISLKYNHTIQSTAGLRVASELIRL